MSNILGNILSILGDDDAKGSDGRLTGTHAYIIKRSDSLAIVLVEWYADRSVVTNTTMILFTNVAVVRKM